MKKTIGLLLVVLMGIGLFLGGRYLYIKNIYQKPNDVVGQILEEAKNDKRSSSFILGESKWESIKNDSVFKNSREPIQWGEFKDFIQQCNFDLVYDNGNASYDTMKRSYKDNNRSVPVVCFEYEPDSLQQLGVKTMNLLLVEYITGEWVVVGIAKTEDDSK